MTKSTLILAFLILSLSTTVQGSEAIGFYSEGSLKEAESIKDRGTNIRKLFLQRQRFYGTTEIQETISDAADFVRQQFPNAELLQIGDIANKSGGVLAEHGSHQNGLDVDIVYLTKNGKLQSQNAPYWEEYFVRNGVVSSNFHVERNLELFRYLVINKQVERIFVDKAIKAEFCAFASKNGLMNDSEIRETLRRLRIANLHVTHFHMRIKCPTTDLKCKAQVVVPAGTGC